LTQYIDYWMILPFISQSAYQNATLTAARFRGCCPFAGNQKGASSWSHLKIPYLLKTIVDRTSFRTILNISGELAAQKHADPMSRDPGYDENLQRLVEAVKVSTGDATAKTGDEAHGSTKSVESWQEPATS
jgi:hypothetical protein